VPVFLDNDPITGNISVDYLEEAFVEGKTKAVMIAHTLGNPFNVSKVLSFCKDHGLWLIEDNCDALGSTYSVPQELAQKLGFKVDKPAVMADVREDNEVDSHLTRLTGTWGDLSTQSFYPPHHMTMGEGGAVNIAGSLKLKRPAESLRDWGRDCWCPSGVDNTCGKRFEWQLGELPEGYDHKYTYAHLGYNLKPLDMQAAIGRVQLRRMKHFTEARKSNWNQLRSKLDELGDFFEFSLPTHALSWSRDGFSWDSTGCRSDCSWFGFMLQVRENAPFTTTDLARHLDDNRIGNRMLFGGNMLRQPALLSLMRERPNSVRLTCDYTGADKLMNQAIFLGTYPGLSEEMIDFEAEVIKNFVKSR
jgi:CDP-6-deoxy-D-xylo-4-hexulose-3-dehydrase